MLHFKYTKQLQTITIILTLFGMDFFMHAKGMGGKIIRPV